MSGNSFENHIKPRFCQEIEYSILNPNVESYIPDYFGPAIDVLRRDNVLPIFYEWELEYVTLDAFNDLCDYTFGKFLKRGRQHRKLTFLTEQTDVLVNYIEVSTISKLLSMIDFYETSTLRTKGLKIPKLNRRVVLGDMVHKNQ